MRIYAYFLGNHLYNTAIKGSLLSKQPLHTAVFDSFAQPLRLMDSQARPGITAASGIMIPAAGKCRIKHADTLVIAEPAGCPLPAVQVLFAFNLRSDGNASVTDFTAYTLYLFIHLLSQLSEFLTGKQMTTT